MYYLSIELLKMSKRIKIKDLLKEPQKYGIGNEVTVKGWVRTKRGSKNVAFIALNDGSTLNNIQIVVDVTENTTIAITTSPTNCFRVINYNSNLFFLLTLTICQCYC